MSCEVEVAALSPASPPPPVEVDETSSSESEMSPTASSTYDWFCSLPMATSAGNAVSNFYEASKNYNAVTQYAIGTVEGSVKKAASVVAPVVHKLDGPIQAVDSYTAGKLASLGDKVPALKSEPEDVSKYLSETKESLVTKISDGRTAVVETLSSGKDAVYSKISSGADAVVNSRAGVICGEGKKAVTTYYTQGKEALGSRVAAGRDAVYSTVQTGAEHLASTRAGLLVGAGVDSTLKVTETLVDYLIPEMENEKELFSEVEKEEKRVAGLPLTRQPKDKEADVGSDDDPREDDEEEEDEKEACAGESRMDRAYKISRKMRLRVFYRSMHRLQSVQESCQSTLGQLKNTVDLLKMVQAARDSMDQKCQSLTTTLKDLEDQLKQLLSRKPTNTDESCSKEGDEEEDNVVPWMNPPRGTLQASLDYAKQLSEKAYNSLSSVTVASRLLPGNLKDSAGQAFQRAHEMYSTLKPVQTPMDLSTSALNKISTVLETQLGYMRQLGSYLSSVLQRPKPAVEIEVKDSENEPTELESMSKEDSEEQ